MICSEEDFPMIIKPLFFQMFRKSCFSKHSENKNHWRKKDRKKRLRRLSKALKLMVCLPSFVVSGRDVLNDDLRAYTSSSGLNTKELSNDMKARVRNDLA